MMTASCGLFLSVPGFLGRLPANVRGAVWMVLSTAAFASMDCLTKTLAHSGLHAFEIASLRSLFGACVVLPFVFRSGFQVMKTKRPVAHLMRSLFGAVAMLTSFYALTQMPLATATALVYSHPLFFVILAALFLKERVTWQRWAAIAVAFSGVLIMMRPGTEVMISGVGWYSVIAAFFISVALFWVKALARTEGALTILAWFAIGTSVFLTLIALPVWQTPTWEQLGIAMVSGTLGSVGQYAFNRSMIAGEGSVVIQFDYAQILFAALFGYLFFSEILDGLTWLGAGIIVAASIYALRRAREPVPSQGPQPA